jgi:nicotinate-nucleotide adenylyltransferase
MLPATVMTSDGTERIGVFGGTFDPVHVAHIVAAVEARRALGLDRVVLVPAGDPWQKRGSVTAPAADRLALVQAAVEGIEGLEVSPLEIERDGPSYTYQTLEALSGAGRELLLIVGADVAATIGSWVGIERLPALATLVVVTRADPEAEPGATGGVGGGEAGAGWEPDGRLTAGWRCERVSIPRLDVSSTGLRARAARGWPLDGLVPAGAVRIITERGLYRP